MYSNNNSYLTVIPQVSFTLLNDYYCIEYDWIDFYSKKKNLIVHIGGDKPHSEFQYSSLPREYEGDRYLEGFV